LRECQQPCGGPGPLPGPFIPPLCSRRCPPCSYSNNQNRIVWSNGCGGCYGYSGCPCGAFNNNCCGGGCGGGGLGLGLGWGYGGGNCLLGNDYFPCNDHVYRYGEIYKFT